MDRRLKQLIYNNRILYALKERYSHYCCFHGKLRIINNGLIRINKEISGGDNQLIVGEQTVLRDVTIHMTGNNNKIIFESNVNVGPGCSFWTEGDYVEILVKSGTTFTTNVHVNAQENNSRIEIGNDCMLSNNIIIRTSDSHPICDMESEERVNPAKNVVIGNHVWIAPGSKIMKGAIIGEGCIIGSDTMVSKEIEPNSLAVGHPAKVVKKNVKWIREQAW